MRLAFLLLLLPCCASAQTVLTGHVLDATTREPLPYCSVVIAGTTNATLTNADGAFRLEAQRETDSLLFSYIGYRERALSVAAVLAQGTVLLTAATNQLDAIQVRPNNVQYERVVRCAQALRKAGPMQARAYFELETHLDERPVEIVECFYNAHFDGSRLERLDLKQGRIGIAPLGDRYFVSLNTTKAISLLDLTAQNEHFPVSPLAFRSVKKLRQRFAVELVSSTDGAGAVDHVLLTPRDSSGSAFTMDLWLDAITGLARAIEVRCTACATHPFRPLWSGHTIQRVDLRFRQTMRPWEGGSAIDHVELDYALGYTSDARPEQVRTHAVVHVFDPGGAFILPIFDYDHTQDDYRKITFQPYDSAFWASAPALVRTDQQQRDMEFLATHGTMTARKRTEALGGNRFFESNYALWSATSRISLKSLPPPPSDGTRPADIQSKGMAAPISQVDLQAQIYLDIDTSHGELRVFTATVFDAFRSYYHLPEEVYTDVFINLFFDICEIQRRKLAAQLSAPGLDLAHIRALHAEAVKEMERTTRDYMLEVRLGALRPALERWNARVKDELGIDNIALFRL